LLIWIFGKNQRNTTTSQIRELTSFAKEVEKSTKILLKKKHPSF
jgi:glycerophosphoryl diester phosphodiesterase